MQQKSPVFHLWSEVLLNKYFCTGFEDEDADKLTQEQVQAGIALFADLHDIIWISLALEQKGVKYK